MSQLISSIAQAIPHINGWQPSEVTDSTVIVPTKTATYRFVAHNSHAFRFFAHSRVVIDDVTAHAIMVNYLDETAPALMAGRMTRLAISDYAGQSHLSSLALVPVATDLGADALRATIARLVVESEIALSYVAARFPQLPTVDLPYATSNMGTFCPPELIDQAVVQGDPLGALAQFVAMHAANSNEGESTIRRVVSILGDSEFQPGEPAEIDGTWGVAATLSEEPTMFQFVVDAGLLTAVMFRRLSEPLPHHLAMLVTDAGNAHADVLTLVVTGGDPRDDDSTITQLTLQVSADMPRRLSDEQLYETLSILMTTLIQADRRLTDYAALVTAEEASLNATDTTTDDDPAATVHDTE